MAGTSNGELVEELRIGLREKNKADKLRRIRRAARALFMKRGYDDTTMRDVVKRANIGLGTLFTYASDKRDLLFLIYNDDLDRVVDEAFERASAKRIFLEQLVTHFGEFYKFFLPQPELGRVVLREMMFYVMSHQGRQAHQFHASTQRIYQHLANLVATAQGSQTIATREEPHVVAEALMSTFGLELRRWIAADEPDLVEGLARLRRMLILQVSGFEPRVGAFVSGRKGSG